MTRVLTSALRISVGEASSRVRAAETLAERMSMTGQPLEPLRPHLAQAQRSGEVSSENADLVVRALAPITRRGFDPDEIDAGEQLLAKFATQFGPKELRQLARKVVDAIDPDGTLPDEQLQQDRRFFRMRPTKDGAYTGEFRLTGQTGAKLQALLHPLAKPRINSTHRRREADRGTRPPLSWAADARRPARPCASGYSARIMRCPIPVAPRPP